MYSSVAFKCVHSPLGTISLAASEKGLVLLSFNRPLKVHREELKKRFSTFLVKDRHFTQKQKRHLKAVTSALQKYFGRKANAFGNIYLDTSGTNFQKKVWSGLKRLRFSESLTYASLARRIGHSKAFRAVGSACGANPICIVIPCHRVVGSQSMGGYSGGLKVKRALLNLESGSAKH